MQKIDKNTWIVLGVVAVILIALFTGKMMKGGAPSKDDMEKTPDSTENLVEEAKPVTKTKKPSSVVAPKLTYIEALEMYGDRRIQIDQNCEAVPNNVTYKTATKVMIDNRSNTTKTLNFGTTFDLGPYDFKILDLSGPKTLLVDCDNRENIATILIQS